MHHRAIYYDELETLGYSKNGIYSKLQAIKNFFKWINQHHKNPTTEPNPIDLVTIKNYFIHLELKGLHSSTIAHYYHDIAQYFVWLEREKILTTNPFNHYELTIKKQAKKIRSILTQQEIKELYQATESLQEIIILHLGYGLGLRAHELEELNIEDLSFSH